MSESKTNPNETNEYRTQVEHYEAVLMHGFRADFSRDVRVHPPVYHVIITREGEREILAWSQANSLEGAREHALKYMQRTVPEEADAADAAG